MVMDTSILTSRQTEILNLISQGYIYKQIAAQLNISVQTVKCQVTEIYYGLRAINAPHAVSIAKDKGLI